MVVLRSLLVFTHFTLQSLLCLKHIRTAEPHEHSNYIYSLVPIL